MRNTVKVIDETDDYIVIDKAAGVQAHPSKPGGPVTLWHDLRELLAYELANGGQISIINRLDRETSGLTLVAKHTRAARDFSRLMMRRSIRKEYLALVWGWPDRDEFAVDEPIGRQGEWSESRIYLKQCIEPRGAPANTTLRVERRFERRTSNGSQFSLVRATPITGRMHQIRVHLAHAGHPVVGDKIYGPDESHYLRFIEAGWTESLASSLILPRHALHSARLAIPELDLSWEAPLPHDMAEFLATPERLPHR